MSDMTLREQVIEAMAEAAWLDANPHMPWETLPCGYRENWRGHAQAALDAMLAAAPDPFAETGQ